MADLGSLVEITKAIAAVALPIVLIVLLLTTDDTAVGILFMPPDDDPRRWPPEEETPPRWRLELIGARQPSSVRRPTRR